MSKAIIRFVCMGESVEVPHKYGLGYCGSIAKLKGWFNRAMLKTYREVSQ